MQEHMAQSMGHSLEQAQEKTHTTGRHALHRPSSFHIRVEIADEDNILLDRPRI
jgi:hypothetical protein